MSHRERMSPVDTTWLRMDRPNNLMMIVGVWMLEGPVALDRVEEQIATGLLGYRRYRQLVERTAAAFFWRDDPNFDIGRHMHRVRLPGRGGKHALERLVGELASEPLDPNHPLWTVHVVEKYEGGAAVIFRMHHAIADGMALMDVTMKLVDGPQHRRGSAAWEHEEEGFLQTLLAPVVAAINSGAEVSGSAVKTALGLVRDPLRAATLLRDGAGVAAELGYLLIMAKDSRDAVQGEARRRETRRLERAAGTPRGQGGQPGARMLDQRHPPVQRRRRDAALPRGLRRQDRGRRVPGAGADRPARSPATSSSATASASSGSSCRSASSIRSSV